MNDIAMKPAEGETEVAVIFDEAKAVAVLKDPAQFKDFYERVKEAATVAEPDVSTAKGRDEIRSAARKVVSTKTKIVATAKSLTEDWRAQTAAVNKTRGEIEEKLAALAAEIRKPLTEWEEADKARQAKADEALKDIDAGAVVTLEDTIETVEVRLQRIGGIEITDELFGDDAQAARILRDRTLEALRAAIERLRREADERAKAAEQAAELDRLRAAAALRQRADGLMEHIRQCGKGLIGEAPQPYGLLFHELEQKVEAEFEGLGEYESAVRKLRDDTLADLKAAMAKDAEERRAREEKEAAEAERRRKDEAKAQADRAAEEAANRAREEERQRAEDERVERERVAAAAEAMERLRSAAIIAVDDTVETLSDRLAAVALISAGRGLHGEGEAAAIELKNATIRTQKEAKERLEAKAEEDRLAARRQADQEHRARIKTEAKVAIIGCGVGEETARKIVLSIVAGEIPHVSIQF